MSLDDWNFGDGGAFPEIHELQYPLGLGKLATGGGSNHGSGGINSSSATTQPSSSTALLKPVSAALVVRGKEFQEQDLVRPGNEDLEKNDVRTTNQLALVIAQKTGENSKTGGGGKKIGVQPSSVVVQVTPQLGNERTIKITEKQLDPLAPAKHKAKKLTKDALGDPAPIVRSPTKKHSSADFLANMIGVGVGDGSTTTTSKTEVKKKGTGGGGGGSTTAAFGGLFGPASSGGGTSAAASSDSAKLAPVVSNYKNPKNHVIPVDIRVAAQGGTPGEGVEKTTSTTVGRQQLLKEMMQKKQMELKQQHDNALRDRAQEQEAQQAKEEADAEAEGLAVIRQQQQAQMEQRKGETKEEREAIILAEREERDRRREKEREVKRQEEKARRAGLTVEELERAQQNSSAGFDVESDERANEKGTISGGDGYETSLFDRGSGPKNYVYNHSNVKEEMRRQEKANERGALDDDEDVFGAAQTLRGKRGREDIAK